MKIILWHFLFGNLFSESSNACQRVWAGKSWEASNATWYVALWTRSTIYEQKEWWIFLEAGAAESSTLAAASSNQVNIFLINVWLTCCLLLVWTVWYYCEAGLVKSRKHGHNLSTSGFLVGFGWGKAFGHNGVGFLISRWKDFFKFLGLAFLGLQFLRRVIYLNCGRIR